MRAELVTPPLRLGIVGGGQLGRMLTVAAQRLAVPVRVLDTDPDSPAGQLTAVRIVADWQDEEAAAWLSDGATAITWEREDLPPAFLAGLAARAPLLPPAAVVADRLTQKRLLDRLGIATAPWAPAAGAEELDAALAVTGLPAMVKARRGGFDGRGQRLVADRAAALAAVQAFAEMGSIVEALIPFDDECATLVVRGLDGAQRHWPLVMTCQHDGQLAWALAPHPHEAALAEQARRVAGAIADELQHVGVLAVEFFRCGDRLLANEIAPRVHNSGHWTIEGAVTDQFANHVRAVLGLPLGETAARGVSLLLNCIGSMPDRAAALAIPGLHLHDYGKQARAARKVGHLTINAVDVVTLRERFGALEALGFDQSAGEVAAVLAG